MSEAHYTKFDAEGVRLRGLSFAAVGTQGPAQSVVLAHHLAGGVAHLIADFGEALADAGLVTLVDDHCS